MDPGQEPDLSGEVMYTTLDQSNTGGTTAQAAGAAGLFKPAGAYESRIRASCPATSAFAAPGNRSAIT
jgi:hypothetical protein